MDDDKIRREALHKKVFAQQVLPCYLGPIPATIIDEPVLDPYPGTGGVPFEPLPELQRAILNRKRETEIYKSTPYEPSEEDTELVLPEKPVFSRPPLLMCKDLDEYLIHGVTKTAIPDTNVLLDIIRSYPVLGFLYLKRYCAENQISYNSYYFTVCSYFDVDPKHYYTISKFGFAEFCSGDSDFIPLDLFARDYEIYLKLVKINFFANYYLIKFFRKWRSKMRKQNWLNLRRTMSERLLFRLHPHQIDREDL